LATTLMGDGYFAYDCANMGRGNRWWYPEFDTPLGRPKGPAGRNADGIWQRAFTGGAVATNGTNYDAVVEPGGKYRDLSTGRVAIRFTLRRFDGRILLPTDAPLTPGEDAPPRLTAAVPEKLLATKLDDGTVAIQTPGGLELRFEPTGALRNILFNGRTPLTGGWPVVAAPPRTHFRVVESQPATASATETEAAAVFAGELTEGDHRGAFVETCTVTPDNRFTLHFDFTANTDLNLRMWRHYFFLPVRDYAGATVVGDEKTLKLPEERGDEPLLSSAKHVEVRSKQATLTVDSSPPLSLIDHRKWGTPDYLLAGYPVSGAVKQGATWSVELTVSVQAGEG